MACVLRFRAHTLGSLNVPKLPCSNAPSAPSGRPPACFEDFVLRAGTKNTSMFIALSTYF